MGAFPPIISEGGSGGHMLHPFNLPQIKTGKDLIEFFETAADFVSKKKENAKASESSSIKFDGVNASIKLIDGPGGKEFALDRGSLKHLDIEGITTDKLPLRFSEGHGMIKVGKIMLDIFNQAIPKITQELKQLGMWDDPTKFFNAEFVWSKTNVVQYKEDFIAIHGINQFYEKTHSRTGEYRPGLTRPTGEDGKPIKNVSSEAEYEEKSLENLKEKIKPIAKKFGFNIYTVVPTMKREDVKSIDFSAALDIPLEIRFAEKAVSKSLKEWLFDRNVTNPRSQMVMLSDGRKIAAMSKLVFQTIMGGAPLSELLATPEDGQAAINGTVFYFATQALGSVILNSLTSPLGDLTGTDTKHEGIVLRSKKLFGPRPVKITGEFITAGGESPFRKQEPEQTEPEQPEETIQEEDTVGLSEDNPNIGRKIAVFPGKFKPPQKGHLDTISCMLEKGVDHLYVLISPIPIRIGDKSIGVIESKKIWDLYLRTTGLGDKVTVIASPFNSPVQASYAVMDGDVPAFIPKPGDMIIPVASDKPDKRGKPDFERFSKFHRYQPKIQGVIPADVRDYFICALEDDQGSINASDFREALEKGEQIDRYVPDGVNPADVRIKLGFTPMENPIPGHLDRVGNDFTESLLAMVEDLLLEGDWQPISKRRSSKGHSRLLDNGRNDLIKHGQPFNQARPVDKSNAFVAKEDMSADPEEELEEASSAGGGAVEGGPVKSPFVDFDEEENHKN